MAKRISIPTGASAAAMRNSGSVHGLHQRQRQIFGIVGRPVIALGVVLVMHALVHEARDHQRHPDDQVPGESEALHRALLDVCQLVDERARAIEREHGDEPDSTASHVGLSDIAPNSAA